MELTAANLTKARAQCWKLYDFVKIAWPHQPGLTHIPFVPGWHIAYTPNWPDLVAAKAIVASPTSR
jgi:hypothetical protein